ncbi:MAG TPA: hypothetical protein VN228_13165 [Pyrinomonadaceae bacterium]|nr:hypothetical protein [Pyrinomonadaceae bacterium]
MASRLTVIFYIILCLEAGLVLTIAPWVRWFGLGDWGDNFFLVFAAQETGFQGLQQAVASGWVRGAVTGLGLLNLAMAFWEMSHFRDTVRRLEGLDAARAAAEAGHAAAHAPADAARAATPDHLSHHERRDP